MAADYRGRIERFGGTGRIIVTGRFSVIGRRSTKGCFSVLGRFSAGIGLGAAGAGVLDTPTSMRARIMKPMDAAAKPYTARIHGSPLSLPASHPCAVTS